MVEPVTTVALLSALSSLLSIAAAVKTICAEQKVSIEVGFDNYKKTAPDKDTLEFLNSNEVHSAVIAMSKTIISPELLNQISNEAKQCEENHIKERKEANDSIGIERAEKKAERCMCSALKSIKRFNNGELPHGGPYQQWWQSYDCF